MISIGNDQYQYHGCKLQKKPNVAYNSRHSLLRVHVRHKRINQHGIHAISMRSIVEDKVVTAYGAVVWCSSVVQLYGAVIWCAAVIMMQ